MTPPDTPQEDASFDRCFGCGTMNPSGLRLKPLVTQEGDEIVARFAMREDHEGWPGLTHGGIVGTVLDEVMSMVVTLVHKKRGATASLNLRFRRPVRTGVPLVARARGVADGRKTKVTGELHEADTGEVLADAKGVWVDVDWDLPGRNPSEQ